MLLPAGELRGRMRRFTQGLLLSRPSGLCFDDAGDLYVTHMGGQVGGPLATLPCCAPSPPAGIAMPLTRWPASPPCMVAGASELKSCLSRVPSLC